MPVDAEKKKLQNCYLGFLKFWKFWDFFQHFFFKKSPQILKFKNGIYVLEEPPKNVYTNFEVIPFRNVVFIAFRMWKMATVQRIWT